MLSLSITAPYRKPAMRSLICIAAVLTLISAGGGSTRVPPHARTPGLLHLSGASRAVGTPQGAPLRVSTTRPRPGAIVEGPLLTFTWHLFPGAAFYYLQLWMACAAPGAATTQDP